MERFNYQKGEIIGDSFLAYLYEFDPYKYDSGQTHRRAVFLCTLCNNTVVRTISDIRSGDTKSCGCDRSIKSGARRFKHGLTKDRLYHVWFGAKARCYNPNNVAYSRYGGRGIKMYEPWINDPESFIKYCYTLDGHDNKNLTLDRINNEGNYEPNNLRFSNGHIQATNQRKKKSKSEYVGVSKQKSGYYSTITINYKHIYLGHFKTPQLAAQARNDYIIRNSLIEYRIQQIY